MKNTMQRYIVFRLYTSVSWQNAVYLTSFSFENQKISRRAGNKFVATPHGLHFAKDTNDVVQCYGENTEQKKAVGVWHWDYAEHRS